jgi:hypothetical protein
VEEESGDKMKLSTPFCASADQFLSFMTVAFLSSFFEFNPESFMMKMSIVEKSADLLIDRSTHSETPRMTQQIAEQINFRRKLDR